MIRSLLRHSAAPIVRLFHRRPAKTPVAAAAFDEGLALHRQGRLSEAEQLYRAVAEPDANYPHAVYNLGLVKLQRGELDAAVPLLRQAVAANSELAEAHNALAVALGRLARYDEAVAHFEQAVAARPDFAEAHCNLATALQPFGRHQEALAHFERALAISPDFAEAHHGRAAVLTTLGDLAAARLALERAIELAPRKAEFYRSLAESKRFTADNPHLAAIEALARDAASLPASEQVFLHFALGKVYADLGRHDAAFAHLLEGNALKRKEIVYDEAAVLERLVATQSLFTAEVISERRGLGDPSSVPVFVIGMPRSGTSLVEQILASHPQVHGAGELNDFEAAVATLAEMSGTPADVGGEELRRIGSRYLERLSAAAPAAARVTDKMPANFRYAGLIHLALPNARIIHTRRDPVDTCLSCFASLFGGDQPFAYDLAELGRYYRGYAGLMEHWRQVLPPEVMLEVRYEELVADFAPQARRIVAHCGLDWDDACLDFHNTRRPVRTASAVQVRQPIYRSSVGRAAPYRHRLRSLLDALDGA